jgi:hypothetical protein
MRQNTLNRGRGASRRSSAATNECLQQALAEREAFLERFPHLRAYQAEIDRMLDKAGNIQGRMAVLGMLTQGKLMDLQRELYKLTQILQSASMES